VLVTHDRYLLDRVSTRLLALDGRGGTEYFADYAQWEAFRGAPPPSAAPRKTGAAEGGGAPRKTKRLSYLEQRELDAMEANVLAAEERLAEAKRRAEDPAIASDAAALQERFTKLSEAQAEVDRLYGRWAELEAKLV